MTSKNKFNRNVLWIIVAKFITLSIKFQEQLFGSKLTLNASLLARMRFFSFQRGVGGGQSRFGGHL